MPETTLMAVWTWGSAGMLAWGLAAAVPIILHLWSRRRFEEMPWGAMEFLLAAVRKNARRIRIEQILLLLLRMVLLVVFAIALADPALSWRAGESFAASPAQTHYLFVIDTSYSMAYRSRDRTRLEAAKEAVQTVLASSRPGDGYSLVLMQDPPQPRIAELSSDRNEVIRQLAAVEVSQGGADLHASLIAIEGQVDSNRRRHPQMESVQIVFLTDLGRVTWDAATQADCQTLLARLANHAQVSLIDVADENAANLAVSRLQSNRPFTTLGETVRLEAEVRSFGTSQTTKSRLEFLVNGRVIDAQDISVPAAGRVIAATEFHCDTAGDIPITARMTADSLPIDDERWLILPVRKSLSVLCVQGEPDAAEYVALALNPGNSADAPIVADVAPESALLDRPLHGYDCVFLNNVAQVGFDERHVLHRFVTGGGGLIIALGDLVQADAYNRDLGEQAGPQRLLPGQLEQLVRDGERYFNPLDYRHSAIAPFRGHQRAGLLTVPTWRYFRLRPYASSELVLAFDNHDPAILAETLGRGRTILVATALSSSSSERSAEGTIPWTALPTWPSFPPLMHSLVRDATAGRELPHNVTVASAFEIRSPSSSASAAQIKLPDGSTRRISLSSVEGLPRGRFAETSRRGVYIVEFEGLDQIQRFAVNVDARESDLDRLPTDELPPQLQSHADLESGEPLLAAPEGLPVFRHLLGVVAILLVVESALAGWFARRAA